MAKRKSAAAAAPTFEAALERLERIVEELEQPELPLERSLAVFEEGVRLSRQLHQRLNEAERAIEVLLKDEEGRSVAVPFTGAGAGAATAGLAGEADVDDEEDVEADEDESNRGGGGGQRALF